MGGLPSEFSEIRHSQSVYRLANMVILEKSINQNLGNEGFSSKKPRLAESTVTIANYIGENYDEWTPSIIDTRQRYLANQAKSIWKINDL
ncbi:HNH endonuclease family protein [Vibrio breoganii]